MSALSTALDAELAKDRFFLFGAVEIALGGGNFLRLLDGGGTLFFDGATWVGLDETYGVLSAIEAIGDGIGDEVPAVSLSILPKDNAATAVLGAATMQGKAVRFLVGCIDGAGQVIADPYTIFTGEVDVPTITAGEKALTVELEVVSASERLFETEEGARLSDAFHQAIWPGEDALFAVTGVEETIYWGVKPPKDPVSYGSQRPAPGGSITSNTV